MSLEMEFDTIFSVMDSWEKLRRIPNHEQVAGTALFAHLFQKCPKTKVLFGFPQDMDPSCEGITQSKHFVRHASNMISMLDRALNLLGPDADLLAEVLSDLGKKHARLGVDESYFPFMGEALIEMMREMLGSHFTPATEHAWEVVYEALSTNMVKSMSTEKSVLESWAKLKTMENYKEVAGGLLFQRLFRKCPETKTLFGFPLEMDSDSEAILNSRRFKMHSTYFIEMLDVALGMVETKQLQQNIRELGARHVDFGVQESYFPIMGEALFYTLQHILGDDWTPSLESAWNDLYGMLSSQMIAAMKDSSKK